MSQFTVTPTAALGRLPAAGRLFVALSRRASPEPRLGPGDAESGAEPFFGKDIAGWDGRSPLTLGDDALGFPIERLSRLPAGRWFAQALYDSDTIFSDINAPGNAYGPPVRIDLRPGPAQRFALPLDRRIPAETVPPDTEFVRHVRIPSRLLSAFWKRPMYLRASVILPKGYDTEPQRRHPVRFHIGGYHTRYTAADGMMADGSGFRRTWLADDTPRMLMVVLDGEAPYGDSYQLDSANNGPYGQATLSELIPEIERRFRAVGSPKARFLDGGSTGGWVAFALQVFYPDFFNGAWSFFADGVDFRYFQLVNIYRDDNAFINRYGYERPSMRDTDGEPRFSIRREVRMENALGRGDSYVASGGQWGAWNAVYGPRGRDGRPAPIWDPRTGKLDRRVAEAWKPYDLRLKMENDWKALGPKLAGKLHIWMGDADNYYLNDAMRLMEKFLKATKDPVSDAELHFGPEQGHGWMGITPVDMMRAMIARAEAP